MRQRPLATIGLTAVLALGTGVATTMFALTDRFLLRTLPIRESSELVVISLRPRDGGAARFSQAQMATIAGLRARDDLFEAVAAYDNVGLERLRLDDGSVVLRRASITDDFFRVLGWPQHLAPSEAAVTQSGAARLLGDATAGRRFARAAGGSFAVGLVLPEAFLFPEPRGLSHFELLTQDLDETSRLDGVTVIARLRRGQSIAAVSAAADSILLGNHSWRLQAETLRDRMTRDVRPLATGALLAGFLILVVAIANVTNLTVARAIYREREFATRIALGASRLDIARLVFLDVAAAAVVALGLGMLLVAISLNVIARIMPAQYGVLGDPEISARVWGFACFVTAILAGAGALIPFMVWNRTGYRHRIVPPTSARHVRILRVAFAVGQTAIAMILMGAAVLLVRSHLNLVTQDIGFTGDVIVASVSYDPSHIGAALTRERETTIERLRAIPGVTGAAAAGRGMLDNSIGGGMLRYRGEQLDALSKEVTAEYFDVVGSVLISGRWLAATDPPRRAIVINEALAQQLRVREAVGITTDTGAMVVGVMRNELSFALDREPLPTAFYLMGDAEECFGNGCNNRIHYVIRAPDRSGLLAAVRQTISSINRDAIVYDLRSIEDRLLDTVRDRSFATIILSLFAAAGLALCTVGLFSLVAFGVARRTREFSIRLAIGASRRHVLGVALAEGTLAVAIGIVIGTVANYWLTQSLRSLTFGVEPGDPSTTLLAASALVAACISGIAVPASRAVRLSPTAALRVE